MPSMKLVLLGLCVLPLAGLRASPRVSAPVDDPPPIECPMCGGNAQLHAQIMTTLSVLRAEISRRALVGAWT